MRFARRVSTRSRRSSPSLDPRPGGEFTVDINGVPVRGAYLEVDRPRRLAISWGHAGSERLPPGASTPVDDGTLVRIVH